MEIKQTPATAAVGCGGSLIMVGGFMSGFYLGSAQARGQPVDPNMASILKYAPTFIGGAYGMMGHGATMSVPGNLESVVENMPDQPGMGREQKEAAAKGCLPVVAGLMGSAILGGTTYLGYAIGYAMNKTA